MNDLKKLIRKVLKEELNPENFQGLSYGMLTNDDKKDIKRRGEEVFGKFRKLDVGTLNKILKDIDLFYGIPDMDYLKDNEEDINFALRNLPLGTKTREKLLEERDTILFQIESIEKYEKGESEKIGRYIEYFREIPKKEGEKMIWSIVNLFDNNISVWVQLINNWLRSIGRTKKVSSPSSLIKYYFELDNGEKAFKDLLLAMAERAEHNEKIIKRTWVGGQNVEKEFVNKLKSNGFDESDIYVFSGEKNVVDGVGIDLAVKCNNRWIPIQVKSSQNDAENYIPYAGFSTFPSNNTFVLISKLNGNKLQRKLSDLCKPLDKVVEDIPDEKPTRGRPPSSVDYFGNLGISS
jgi:hypothetical protein